MKKSCVPSAKTEPSAYGEEKCFPQRELLQKNAAATVQRAEAVNKINVIVPRRRNPAPRDYLFYLSLFCPRRPKPRQ